MEVSNFFKTLSGSFVAALILLSSLGAQAQSTRSTDFSVKKGAKTNLLKETPSLELSAESTVQKKNAAPNLHFTLMGGVLSPNFMTVNANTTSTNYNFGQPTPMLNAQFSVYPANFGGNWGGTFSIGYSYLTTDLGPNSTALHIIPLETLLAYRFEKNNTQKLIPFVTAGPALWSYFQRGLDQFNTSQSFLTGIAGAGVAVNLNRLGWIDARNDSEILLQYKRIVAPVTDTTDFNGYILQLGGSLAF